MAKIKDLSPERMEVTADRMLLYAADGDEFLDRVHAAGIEPLTELVRRSTPRGRVPAPHRPHPG